MFVPCEPREHEPASLRVAVRGSERMGKREDRAGTLIRTYIYYIARVKRSRYIARVKRSRAYSAYRVCCRDRRPEEPTPCVAGDTRRDVALALKTNGRFLTDIGKYCRWVRNDTSLEFVAVWDPN